MSHKYYKYLISSHMRSLWICLILLVANSALSQNKGVFVNFMIGNDFFSADPVNSLSLYDPSNGIIDVNTGQPLTVQVGYFIKRSNIKYGLSYGLTHRVVQVRFSDNPLNNKIGFNQHALSLSMLYCIPVDGSFISGLEFGGDIGIAVQGDVDNLLFDATVQENSSFNVYNMYFDQSQFFLPVYALYGQVVRPLSGGSRVNLGIGVSGQIASGYSLSEFSNTFPLGEGNALFEFNYTNRFLIWTPFVKLGIDF